MTARPKIDSGIEEFANDLGKPWQWEEDGYTVTRGCAWSAPGCHPVGCGVKFYVNKDGILEKIEGDENQPITQGRLCVRCLTLPDFTYHPGPHHLPDEACEGRPREEQVGAHHVGRRLQHH